jgi:CRP/FNR family transcriptional regulator, anaerobic regulatory protein
MNMQVMINPQIQRRAVYNVRTLQRACTGCIHSKSCLPGHLTPGARAHLSAIVRRPRTLRRGEHLYWPGAVRGCIYVLRSGAVKTCILDQCGDEQITGFYGPGEWVGLDAFGKGSDTCAAVALADTALCALPFGEIDKLCATEPNLRQHLWCSLCQATEDSQAHAMLLADKPAEQRLAVFLV